MIQSKACDICGEGKSELKCVFDTFYILGAAVEVPVYFYACDTCGCEYGDVATTRRNKEDAKKTRSELGKSL